MWLDKISQIWKIKDLRNNILIVLGLLVVYRLAAHVPIPGVDLTALKSFFNSNQILGLMNIFSGGGMENFSIIALAVGPYITASIILQLLAMIIPRLEELSKEGEYGRQKINMYTRWLTVPLAFLQGYGTIIMLNQSSLQILTNMSSFRILTTMTVMTAGTIFAMWIGELISERKIGNGISLIIFVGIVTRIPSSLKNLIVNYDATQLFNFIVFLVIAAITIAGVVYITEAQRNIPVSYARRIKGNRVYGGTSTYLPLRVNMAGVIPIIFAISLILFPPMIAQFLLKAKTLWVVSLAQGTISLFNNQIFYGALYFILVFAFTYFYTAVIFHPQQIAENLQKSGGFVPGIRPGNSTADYLQKTTSRILLIGALFLALIAVLPMTLQPLTGTKALTIGGTSLLIVVSVVIETVKQLNSQLTMRDYEEL